MRVTCVFKPRATTEECIMSHSVCVIGLGTVGLPTAVYLQNVGCEVIGYDVNSSAIARANMYIPAVRDLKTIPQNTEVFIICVSTMFSQGKPDAKNVNEACFKISDLFHPKLVSVESTVPIGTCRAIHNTIFDGEVNLAHVPHRYWPGDPKRFGVAQTRVAGAVNNKSLIEAKKFYRGLAIPILEVEPVEIAEMAKIAENAYRYVQISFAEELREICERNNINFDMLREACNSKWNIEIPEARTGIGGTCLPKDIQYLVAAAQNKMFEPDLLISAIHADRKYVEHLQTPLISR